MEHLKYRCSPVPKTVHPQNVRFHNVRFQNVQNVRFTKRQIYKSSCKPDVLKPDVSKPDVLKLDVFKPDVLKPDVLWVAQKSTLRKQLLYKCCILSRLPTLFCANVAQRRALAAGKNDLKVKFWYIAKFASIFAYYNINPIARCFSPCAKV
jgi:hypothetical protein